MKHRTAAVIVVAAAVATALIVVLGAVAGAKPTRHIRTVKLLDLTRGRFEVSLGDPPAWMPLSGTPETLTLIAGAPARPGFAADNAYVGFTGARARCAATPATSKSIYSTLTHFFSSAHAGTHAGVFAPNGGAPASSYVDSAPEVIVPPSSAARACIWLARDTGATRTITITVTRSTGPKHKKHKKREKKQIRAPRSLVTSLVIPLLNRTFAASVSNLAGATPGNGGYSMYAIDGGHAFRYSVSTLQCNARSTDGATTVNAGTPASESISISTSPCPTDASRFQFRGADVNRTLSYPLTDAMTAPAVTVTLGGCELDPLTGAALTAAETYLTAVGCKLGTVQVTPYQKTLPRGAVAWAAVDGGVAELAPAGTTVDLVVNGSPD